MVATAQRSDRPSVDRGPGAAGGRWQRGARQNQRTDLQNRLLHAALNDIAAQLPWPPETGELHPAEWWKRRATLQWLLDTKEQPDLIGSLDGLEFAILLPHTSDLSTKQCAALNEWLFIFGAQNGVVFKDDGK